MKLPQHLHKIMRNKNSQVASLVTHVNYLAKLTESIRSLLSDPLSSHIQVVNYQQNVLTISADNPVWASRMRYAIPELRHKLKINAIFPGKITEIVVKITPTRLSPALTRTPLRTIDSTSLLSLANQVSDDSLKQALLRLATHTQKFK